MRKVHWKWNLTVNWARSNTRKCSHPVYQIHQKEPNNTKWISPIESVVGFTLKIDVGFDLESADCTLKVVVDREWRVLALHLKKRSWLRLESADFTLKIEAKLDCRVLFLHWKYRLTLNGECWLCTENRSWLRLESAVFTLKIEVVSERRVLASHWK